MNRPRHGAGRGARFVSVGVAVVASVLFSGNDAGAQAGRDSVALPSVNFTLHHAVRSSPLPREIAKPLEWAPPRISTELGTDRGWDLRSSPGSFGDVRSAVARRPAAPAVSAGRHRPTGRKLLGGLIGATAGFFAGAYLGAAIEGQGCACDDPGLKGAMIGAPIGTVAGAVLGVKLY